MQNLPCIYVHEFIQRAPLKNPIIACDASTYLSTREVSLCWLFILWQYAGKERRRRHNVCAVGVSVQPFASWIWSVRAFHCEWHQPLRAGTRKAGRRHQLESSQIRVEISVDEQAGSYAKTKLSKCKYTHPHSTAIDQIRSQSNQSARPAPVCAVTETLISAILGPWHTGS